MLAGALLALAIAAPVLAHAKLVASDPADKAVLTIPPTTVTVTFSEAIDPDRSRFKLVGPDGTVGTGRIADDPAVLVLAGLDLGPGAYEIQWTAASDDGHIERGRLRFTVSAPTPAPPSVAAPTATPAPSPSASAAPGSAGAPSAPAAGLPPPSAVAGPTLTAVPAEPAAGSAGSAGDMLLPVVVAAVVVAGVGMFVLRRSRRA